MENISKEINYKMDSITDNFSSIIDLALKNIEKADEILLDSFTRFRENIKDCKGKAPLITGIMEFLYFEFCKRYISSKLKIDNFTELKSKLSTEAVYYYKSSYNKKNIILCSDIDIGEKNHIKIKLRNPETDEILKLRPDIFIALEDENNKVIPIAFIEIKQYTDMSRFRESIFDRFEGIKLSLNKYFSDFNPYFIVINIEAYKSDEFDNEFIEFQKKLDNFLYLKRDWNQEYWNIEKKGWDSPIKGLRINQILDKVIELIKEYIK